MRYEVIPFGNLLKESIRNGLTKPKAIRGQGAKMIAMGEIFANSRIGSINMDRVPVTDKELNNCGIEVGDLLFARQSLVLEGAGKCSIITVVDEPTVFESHLIRVRIDTSKANPYFLYYYFNSHHGKENIKTIVEQVAAAGIRGSDLIRLNVPSYPARMIFKFIQEQMEYEISTDLLTNLSMYHRTITILKQAPFFFPQIPIHDVNNFGFNFSSLFFNLNTELINNPDITMEQFENEARQNFIASAESFCTKYLLYIVECLKLQR